MVLKAIRRVGNAQQNYDYSGYCRSEITELFWIPACAGMTVLKAIRRVGNAH